MIPAGLHRSSSITYISGTGTAGADNTAQTVKGLVLPPYTLREVGDRLHIQAIFQPNGIVAISGAVALNTVAIANSTVSATGIVLLDTWLQFIDSTHANIIETDLGLIGNLTEMNAAGFDWTAAQALIFTQSMTAAEHLTLFALIVDIYPKG